MTLSDAELVSRMEFARRIALEAGEIALGYFQHPDLGVDRKADNSPVTAADREAEEHLRRAIGRTYPNDGILGEEFGASEGSSGLTWVLDPIDGTKSFVQGVPLFGTMVGLVQHRHGLVGVVNIPALGEIVYAASGQGAWYGRRGGTAMPARVSSTPELARSLFLTTDLSAFERQGRRAVYDKLQSRCRLARTWGDCYGYLLVAVGRAEVMIDPVLNLWDAAPLQPILEEAGGTFTDWRGAPSIDAGECIGSNGLVLDEVLSITRDWARDGSAR